MLLWKQSCYGCVKFEPRLVRQNPEETGWVEGMDVLGELLTFWQVILHQQLCCRNQGLLEEQRNGRDNWRRVLSSLLRHLGFWEERKDG